jgi:hypothetical protein
MGGHMSLITENLTNLFDSQINCLRKREVAEAVLTKFQNKKEFVITRALSTGTNAKNIPFLPIIPNSYYGVYGTMMFVHHDGKIGYTGLEPHKIT